MSDVNEAVAIQTERSEEMREQPPAELLGSVKVKLHTRQGYFLVFSRRADGSPSPVVGLYRFAKRMSVIWFASSQDDPYADMFLDRVYAGLMEAKRELEDHERRVDSLLEQAKRMGLEVDLAASAEPVEAEMRFSNPYGFLGANLVVQLDHFVRKCYTCRHIALMSPRECEEHVRWGVKLVARTFFLSTGFKATGVTRDDWRADNARWRQALEAYGGKEPPRDILEGARRPQIAPMIGKGERVQAA